MYIFERRTRNIIFSFFIEHVVYYESIKRERKTKPRYECGGDERLKTKDEESTHLTYTGLVGELEHLKIKTRLIDEMFVMRWVGMCS